MTKTAIAILTGGESSEREVALRSAQAIAEQLLSRFNIVIFDFPHDRSLFLRRYTEFAVAIPIFHGRGGEDGMIQGFLKTLDVPFLFSDVAAHALALHKDRTKRIVAGAGIQTPFARVVSQVEAMTFAGPCVVKPIDGGSSLGVFIVYSEEELRCALQQAFGWSEEVLVEEYVVGDEFTVAVIDEGVEVVALPVIQIKSKNTFFDFESKYKAELVEEICPAQIEEGLAQRLQEVARIVHRLIGARHMSRTDLIVDKEGKIWFLEINTIPGQTLQSLFPKAVRASGRDFSQLLARWIEEEATKKTTLSSRP